MQPNEITPHLFRIEYSKIVAVLCKTFRIKNIEIAEDIASETFLKASETWPGKGLPPNPTAWLYTVAKNKAKDYFKHLTIVETHLKQANEGEVNLEVEFEPQQISDSQLAMIFAVCNSSNSTESQISLALQILCGFSVQEIANAFLTKTETIKKRLQRGRDNLRDDNFQITSLTETDIRSRLDTVLKTLYLFFNEGYFSKTNDQLIRKELCFEAIRLSQVLTEHATTDTPQTNALLALMYFQSSRLEARVNTEGKAILFDKQDKNLWDQSLIGKGNFYLVRACEGNEISTYHLQAAIAYWHCTPTDKDKWNHILRLYDQLIQMDDSPIILLSRTFAFAQVYGREKAIPEAEALNLIESSSYYALLGYLHAHSDPKKAIAHYARAIQLTKSKTEKQTLQKEMEALHR